MGRDRWRHEFWSVLAARLPLKRRKPSEVRLRDLGLEFLSGRIPSPKEDGWYVFSTVRNEMLRLPYFLQYYREMGASTFVIADNDSGDGTAEYLSGQPDVLLFRARGAYSESRCGVDWLNGLLSRFGRNRWCLTVDADELLVFPYCERSGLPKLTRYLEVNGANALPAFLLDMYPRDPIREVRYEAGTPFTSVCPFFDPTGYLEYETVGPGRRLPSRGGPRYRLFWEGHTREKPPPFLVKYPLVLWSERQRFEASTHVLTDVRAADITGALLHFKFLDDFAARAEEEAARQEHFNGASQYEAYREVVSSHPEVCAFNAESACYRSSLQLLDMGLIHSSEAFHSSLGAPPDAPIDDDRASRAREGGG